MLGKLVVALLLIAAAWFGLTWIARSGKRQAKARRQIEEAAAAAVRRQTGAPPPAPVSDMVACPACGTYQEAGSPKRCDRTDCPYPSA